MGKVLMTVFSAHPTDRIGLIKVPIKLHMQDGLAIEGARITYSGGAYNEDVYTPVPTIKPGASLIVEVTLRSQWHMAITDIPRRFSFKLLQARGDTLAKVTGNVDHAWYVPSALKGQFDPAPFGLETFNVLVFGVMGSGKTSFTNSILALMSRANSGEALPCAEPVHGGGDHCTVSLRCIDFPNELPLRVWDTKGLTLENYKGPELEAIMKGKLPHGWDMDCHIDPAMLSESQDLTVEAKRFGRTPHAVVFMLPFSELDDTTGEFMGKIRDQFGKIVRLGINPIVLVAKLDEADDAVRENPSASNGAKDAALKAAADFLGIPVGNVYPCINYLDLTSKSFEIDRNLAVILHRILSMAKHRCESLEREASHAARMADQTTLPPIHRKIAQLQSSLADATAEADARKAELAATAARADGLADQLAIASACAEQGEAERATAAARADFLNEQLGAEAVSGAAVRREKRALEARLKARAQQLAALQARTSELVSQRKACFCLIGVAVASFVVVTSVAPGWLATAAAPPVEKSLLAIASGQSRAVEDFVSCNDSMALGDPSAVASTPPCLQEMEAAASALVAMVAAAKQPDRGSTFLGTAASLLVVLALLLGGAAFVFGAMKATPTDGKRNGMDFEPCTEPEMDSDSESFEEISI